MAVSFKTHCLQGLSVLPVNLEVDVTRGMPLFSIIGMAGTSVQEAKERVRSAIVHSGYKFPLNRKIVNLAPAELRKSGSHFDVAIALGFLVTSGQISPLPRDVMVIGELGLEGGVRAVSGILPAVVFAREQGMRQVVLPVANLKEASLVEGIELVPVKSLREVIGHFEGEERAEARVEVDFEANVYAWDFGDISGHSAAKRALLIAAAGGHHVLMSGPPGSGKSMLSRSFLSILPPLSREELLEVLKIYSVAGHTIKHVNFGRPFRRVHHSCSTFGLIGGGVNLMPGEISLAHRGVLFMDEFPEFARGTLEALRAPLEEKELVLRRGSVLSSFPCQFQLIAAMNPCPCGHYGDSVKACSCGAAQVARYRSKVSGPIMDRIDLHIEVPRIPFDELSEKSVRSSAEMRAEVIEARERQRARLKEYGYFTNHEMSSRLVKAEKLDAVTEELLRRATDQHGLSGRGVYRLIKVARTIADLDGVEQVKADHLMEALQYRLN